MEGDRQGKGRHMAPAINPTVIVAFQNPHTLSTSLCRTIRTACGSSSRLNIFRNRYMSSEISRYFYTHSTDRKDYSDWQFLDKHLISIARL
jgi:hypothetical protein